MRTWLRRLAYLLFDRHRDAELREEIELHRSLRQAHLERDGVPSSDAEDESRHALGNVLLAREEAREVWLGPWSSWSQDLCFGLRMVRRSPGVAAIVTLTMALGIGMNAAMFGVFNAVLLRPLPVPDAERLVWVANHDQRFNQDTFVSRANFLIWREQATSFERMVAYMEFAAAMVAAGESREEQVTAATSDVWNLTGARPLLGRLFGPDDEHVAVLSHAAFERRFRGDPAVIGTSVALNGFPMTVIGVLGRDFRFPMPAAGGDVAAYMPLSKAAGRPGLPDPPDPARGPLPPWVTVVGKLRAEVSIDRARADLERVYADVAREHPVALREGRALRVVPLREKLVGRLQIALTVLLAAVGCVLMIATTNIAHLMLARAVSRQTEIAIRISVGASRGRIIRQLLTESLLLAAAGCGAGLALATWGLDAIITLWPDAIPRLKDATVDSVVLLFAAVTALASTLLFGLGPALSLLRTDLNTTLKRQERSGSATPGTRPVRVLLIGFELGLATVLLIAAGLMLKSFWAMGVGTVPDGDRILVTRVALSGSRYASRAPQEAYVQELLQRVDGTPGVSSAGIDAGAFNVPVKVDGRTPPVASGGDEAFVTFRPVSLGFVRAMGAPLLRGHWPAPGRMESDALESTDALLVNQRFVDLLMQGRDPIGHHISGPFVSGTVAGVIADFKDSQLDAEPSPQVYVPFKRAMTLRSVRVAIRTDGSPSAVAPAVRDAMSQIDPTQPIADMATMDQVLEASIANRRFSLAMLGIFAGVALFLSLMGTYGVIAHSVAERTREIGIRIALGARPSGVVRMIVGGEMRIAVGGIAAGVLLAFGIAPVMTTLVYGVAPRDTGIFLGVAGALASVALLTAWAAAARAARVDPIAALQH